MGRARFRGAQHQGRGDGLDLIKSQGLLFSASGRPGSPHAAFGVGDRSGDAETSLLENRGISALYGRLLAEGKGLGSNLLLCDFKELRCMTTRWQARPMLPFSWASQCVRPSSNTTSVSHRAIRPPLLLLPWRAYAAPPPAAARSRRP